MTAIKREYEGTHFSRGMFQPYANITLGCANKLECLSLKRNLYNIAQPCSEPQTKKILKAKILQKVSAKCDNFESITELF
jgi:hypothetical protein